ncbi:hypothetical protein AB0J80_07440 [Actinoplanes sp. NPDC049548]|uniref:trypsin-like serine peptidase n=1 Tax=Actinoplanes sp. NPDC049548 TaxID=3155152 RepID=UPI0034226AFC
MTIKRIRATVLAAVLVTTGLTVASGPASAAPTPAATGGGATSGSAAALWQPGVGAVTAGSDADVRRVVDAYWTPARLAAAKPADVAADKWRSAASKPAAPAGDQQTVAQPVASPGGKNRDAWFSYTTGKVYFRNASNGGNYMCSAGAINSGSKRLVLTAGHCVHGGKGGTWHQNWVFIPGYYQGNRPLGTFPATYYRTFNAYINDSDYTRDVAFVVTGPNASGSLLVNAAGGHGLVINPGEEVYVHVAGYPGNKDNGEVQWYCWGTTSSWSIITPGTKIACGFGGGASGGPWLRDYQSNGLGYAVSETMGIDGSNNYGPYFDDAVRDMFNVVKDMT